MISALNLGSGIFGRGRSRRPARGAAQAIRPAVRRSSAVAARPARVTRVAKQQATTWEIRTFSFALTAIAAGFLLAVLYLGQMTGLSASGYETQRLEATREELLRQHSLLDVELARLEAPARIETQAARLGLFRLAHVPIMNTEELTARR